MPYTRVPICGVRASALRTAGLTPRQGKLIRAAMTPAIVHTPHHEDHAQRLRIGAALPCPVFVERAHRRKRPMTGRAMGGVVATPARPAPVIRVLKFGPCGTCTVFSHRSYTFPRVQAPRRSQRYRGTGNHYSSLRGPDTGRPTARAGKREFPGNPGNPRKYGLDLGIPGTGLLPRSVVPASNVRACRSLSLSRFILGNLNDRGHHSRKRRLG